MVRRRLAHNLGHGAGQQSQRAELLAQFIVQVLSDPLLFEGRDFDHLPFQRVAAHPFHGYAETWHPETFSADHTTLWLLSREEHDRGGHLLRRPGTPDRRVRGAVLDLLRLARGRLHPIGRDGVHGDPRTSDLDRERAREAVHRGLRGAVAGHARVRDERPRDRRHVHDAAASALEHRREHRAGHVVGRHEVHVHLAEEVRGREVHDVLRRVPVHAELREARVVHEDVDRAEARRGLGDERPRRRLVGQVGGETDAPLADLRGAFVDAIGRRCDRDGSARLAEHARAREADAGGTPSPRDERDATVESEHGATVPEPYARRP